GRVWRQLLYMLILLLGVGLGALSWAIVEPLSMAGFATQSGILFLILATWIPFVSVLVFIEHWRRFPVALPLLVVTLVAHILLSYDNHALRLGQTTSVQRLQSFDAALQQWGVVNKAGSKRPSPPLIILATAGGGSRAAYWTATVLGALQDADSEFRSRLFAV